MPINAEGFRVCGFTHGFLEKVSLWISFSRKHVFRPGPGWGPVRVGAHMGPYGPLWAHIWAHMGPPGQVWEKASTFRQLSVKTFGQISHVSGPKLIFS